MLRIGSRVSFALIVLGPLLAGAAPLSMTEAVEEALASSPHVVAAAHRTASKEAQVEAAQSAYLPRISVQAQYLARSPKNKLPIELPPIPGVPPVGDIDDIHHLTADLVLGYRLFDLTSGPRLDAAALGVEASRFEEDKARAELAFGVRATFLAALFSRDVEAIAVASLAVARGEEARMAKRAEIGVESGIALAQTRVRVAELEAQWRRAKSDRLRYRTQLQILLGRSEPPEVRGDLTDLAKAADVGDQEPPDIEMRVRQRKAVESLATSKARGIIPTVDLFASIGVAYPRALQLELGPVYQAGVRLQWMAFDGFLRDAEVRGLDNDAAALSAVERGMRLDFSRALADLAGRRATALAELESANRVRAETKVYLDVAKTALATGAGTQLDVHTAELGLDRATVAAKKAELELALVQAETLRVHGIQTETSR